MKKFWPLLILLISSLFIISCDDKNNDDYVDHDTISTVYDYKGVNFTYNDEDGWNFYRTFPSGVMYNSDVVLIYLQTDTNTNGSPIWTPIPAKFNPTVNNVTQEVYYDFDFSVNDFKIYVRGTYDLAATPNFINNQTFRVVLVPGGFGNKNANATDLRKMSYEDVIKKYNINDSNVTTLK